MFSVDNMFTDVLDEGFISHFDKNKEECKVLSKTIKMDALTQVSLGVMSQDQGEKFQIID